MRKSKTGLLDGVVLGYSIKDGLPTIEITATMTTRAQVDAVIESLTTLREVLPEARARKSKATKKKGGSTMPMMGLDAAMDRRS